MNQTKEVRTRFAPSPTGFLHVGGARTALFNYLYARSQGGKFILRIEDTDQNRSTEDSFKIILESLQWLGIQWDEGPGVGGDHGPYIQSERLGIYKEYTDKLLKEKKAYRCFCTQEELEAKKKQAEAMGVPYVYDGLHANMSDEEVDAKLKAGIPYSIRFKTPSKTLIIDDIIQGKVKFETKLIGDFIIVKSDGFPSYNYAVVVDDALMKISHVIRGVGHLSNTPRQILLYEALGYEVPEFAHASEIVGMDGKKLSKRAGATSILAFRDLGYLPETFRNYMALLGWTSPDGREFLTSGELETIFDVHRCSKSPSTFDVFKKPKGGDEEVVTNFSDLAQIAEAMNPKSKLNWLSNRTIRDLNISKVLEALFPFIRDRKDIPEEVKNPSNTTLTSIVESVRVYLDNLTQAPDYIAEFFVTDLRIQSEEAAGFLKEGDGPKVVGEFYGMLKKEAPKTDEDYKNLMSKVGEISGQKGKTLYMPIRAATTGKSAGLELPILFPLLGKEKLLQRIEKTAAEVGISLSS
ncbi:glutamate--tRNA ligase [Leptospira gomenensis]|uniref:Glutamate--tRNA ligase n=1 Tax=Leptospira gomenensis TaxID=2484974 RepID=A0A5F1YCV0_9LEPT|nr:glutamate--tRNA ligase [Leptospira gomenensis]TGK35904.1 glutamate--tRNA ligase [Leptospira gomenensis]TGK40064.1 glutamate--tRNA ligase [Leptospira gomenensis]TGK51514.1 glutamate--tRNA ligase [Leptospira gomenensis]TGK68071.1 glutamate--tRNA ligase [Leptospira gomenensis]